MTRLLAVLPDHPYPLDMGSRVRNLRILEALASRFELTILTQVHDSSLLTNPGPVAELGRCVSILAPHRRSAGAKLQWHLRYRLGGSGLHSETYFQSLPELSKRAAALLNEISPAIVHVGYWYGLRHLRRFSRPPIWIVDTHDVQFERQERLWGRVAPRERALELSELSRYDRVIAITDHDRDVFSAQLPAATPIDVIGMGLDMAHWDPAAFPPERPDAPRVGFYGNLSNLSNVEGTVHLQQAILPRVASQVSDLECLVLGAQPPGEIRSLATEAPWPTEVTGFVEDVRPWLRSMRVLALSLRSGSGQRGRVVEALAMGVPVVGYPGTLEGLDLVDGEGIAVAGSETEFASHLARLLSDVEEARSLGETGRQCVNERYGLAETYGRFPRLYEQLLRE